MSLVQIVSALAIVLSVVYAVSELKRARALTSTDLETMLYGRLLEMDRLVAENDDLADIVLRATSDPQSLDTRGRTRYLAFEHIFYDSWEAALEANQSGLIDSEQFADWEAWFTADAERRLAIGWEGNLRFYNPAFIEYVEARVSRVRALSRGTFPPALSNRRQYSLAPFLAPSRVGSSRRDTFPFPTRGVVHVVDVSDMRNPRVAGR